MKSGRTDFIEGEHLTSHLSAVIHRDSHSVVDLRSRS
jgi:hypothetical protein